MFNYVQKKSQVYQQSPKVRRMVQDIIRNKVKKKQNKKTIVIKMEVLNMEVRLLVFFLVSVLQKIDAVSAENSGKNSFSCFIIFRLTLSAL